MEEAAGGEDDGPSTSKKPKFTVWEDVALGSPLISKNPIHFICWNKFHCIDYWFTLLCHPFIEVIGKLIYI